MKTKVLYVGDHDSRHDHKWIGFLSSNCLIDYAFAKEGENIVYINGVKLTLDRGFPVFSLPALFSFFKEVRWWRKYLRNNNFTIIHVFIGTRHIIPVWLLGLPYIITTRGTDVNETLKNLKRDSSVKGRMFFYLMKRAFLKAHQVTSTSESQINSIKMVFNDSVPSILIRTGVDVGFIEQFQNKQKHKRIVVPRGLRAVYQPELTLQSLDLISDKLFDYEILLFHTEDEKDLAESYLNKFKTLNINLVEFLPPKELWEILASSTLVIMNPLHDGTPNSALESMILKTPVIIGACEYDTSIFNDQTVNKLRNNDKSELAELVLASLDSYPEEKLNAAYNAVKMNATQSIEMRKVKSLYDQLSH